LIKEPTEQVEALVKVVNDYPKAVYIRNVAFYLMRGLKPVINDPEKLRPLLNRFVEGTATATPYARSEFYNSISKELINNGVLLDMAERLAKETIPYSTSRITLTRNAARWRRRRPITTPRIRTESRSSFQ
jgi:hypothetical protein